MAFILLVLATAVFLGLAFGWGWAALLTSAMAVLIFAAHWSTK